MNQHVQPKGFIRWTQELTEAMHRNDCDKVRSTLKEITVRRDEAFDRSEAGWWNALLTIGQLSNEFLSSIETERKIHDFIERDSSLANALYLIGSIPGLKLVNFPEIVNQVNHLREMGLVVQSNVGSMVFLSSRGISCVEQHDGEYPKFCIKGENCPMRLAKKRYSR